MEIRNFNYFDNQHVAGTKNATNKVSDHHFDLDLKMVDRHGDDPIVQGGTGFSCITRGISMCTDCCTPMPTGTC